MPDDDNPRAYLANLGKPATQSKPKPTPPTGNPRGNPEFTPGNTIGFQPGESGNPGGVIRNKPLRASLLRLIECGDLKSFKPKNMADRLVLQLVKTAMSGKKTAMQGMKEVWDRCEGKAAPSTEETDAMAEQNKVIVINTVGRPYEED